MTRWKSESLPMHSWSELVKRLMGNRMRVSYLYSGFWEHSELVRNGEELVRTTILVGIWYPSNRSLWKLIQFPRDKLLPALPHSNGFAFWHEPIFPNRIRSLPSIHQPNDGKYSSINHQNGRWIKQKAAFSNYRIIPSRLWILTIQNSGKQKRNCKWESQAHSLRLFAPRKLHHGTRTTTTVDNRRMHPIKWASENRANN